MKGLARGTVYNLLGMGAPLVAGLVSIPILVAALGTDRFGVLALAWTITGYFGLFDLGLGRAITQLTASRVSATGDRHAPAAVWPAMGFMLALGAAGGAALALAAPWLAGDLLRIPPSLVDETRGALYVLAAGIPFVVVMTAFTGVLTAFHEFGALNAIRGPMGVMILAAPALVVPFSTSLVPIAWSLVAVRVTALAAMALASRRFLPPIPGAARADVRALFGFGAWMTVSNVISPVLVHLDRFLIGALVSMTAVAHYATPHEVVTKALVIPGAVVGVLFPAFAASSGRDAARLERLFVSGTRYIGLGLWVPLLAVVLLAEPGLTLWLGAEFAAESAPVMRWIAVGVFVNCLAQVPFSLVQGVGRPDLTAKFHLLELPLYVALLWWSIGRWGIVGAAMAWSARVSLDALLLFGASARLIALDAARGRRMALWIAAAVAVMLVPLALGGWR